MDNTKDSLLDLFIFETSQNLEQLEQIILEHEKTGRFTGEAINEIFRIMHTIKGSAAMMNFDNVSAVAHRVEDLFFFIREKSSELTDYDGVADLVFECLDFIRGELDKIKEGRPADRDGTGLEEKIRACVARKRAGLGDEKASSQAQSKGSKGESAAPEEGGKEGGRTFSVRIFFEEGCQMESLRAFDIVNRLSSFAAVKSYDPGDVMENDDSASAIKERGFFILFSTEKGKEYLGDFFAETLFLREFVLEEQAAAKKIPKETAKEPPRAAQEVPAAAAPAAEAHNAAAAAVINVNVNKLDKLMNLVGELVISEAMVTENSDLAGLQLENFVKASRQLHKITAELQDTVMSIRMVPLGDVFQKMHRIVRDMSKKLDKEVKLDIIGAETEADKNIINHLSDPLMHLVRNCIDHGLEGREERLAQNKPEAGTVTLEAVAAGNDVLVMVSDDGRGLDREKILKKAAAAGLLKKNSDEMTDSEVYSLIFLPGFSTNEEVTEYSGRGVGMDVVTSNVEEVGGSVFINSTPGEGTAITMKIPLTVAIVDGMNIRVGSSRYTLPTASIKESFRPKKESIFKTPDGEEMIMVRGQCYPIVRLHETYGTKTEITDFTEGIFIMVEQYEQIICLFADELVGQKQVVVKAMPKFIRGVCKLRGLAGCTLLGDGGISLILDIGFLTGNRSRD